MRKLYVAGAGVVVALVLMSTSATGVGPVQYTQIHGSICQSQNPNIAYSQYGVHNTAPSGAGGAGGGNITVTCPLPVTVPSSGAAVPALAINYYDRGISTRVVCTVEGVDASGNFLYVDQKTSPTGGAGSGLQTFNFTVSINPAVQRMLALCTLPGANGAEFSHITGFQIGI